MPFDTSHLKNFKDETFGEYGKAFEQLVIDIDDVDDTDLLIELPKALRFIHGGLTGGAAQSDDRLGADKESEVGTDDLEDGMDRMSLKQRKAPGAVFVHCAAGKSRSVATVIAYLLWRYPERFDPNTPVNSSSETAPRGNRRPRKDTAAEAVDAALEWLRRTRPMAEPNDGFMDQLRLWWEMGCPDDVEGHPLYQRWNYKREVEENTAVGLAPTRLRFEDEEQIAGTTRGEGSGVELRCKKCRRTLATAPFITTHGPSAQRPSSDEASAPTSSPSAATNCPHVFIEPLSWMRPELEKGSLNGRLLCPNARCGAGVGRYDWKGFKCSCGEWVTPAFSLQRARVDEAVAPGSRRGPPGGSGGGLPSHGIRMPPGARGQGGNL